MTTGRPAWRWLLYFAAAGVIALAMLVGILRLLLPLATQYQEDIRAWASTATGYDIRFERISAGWPLAGPQLSFFSVTFTRPGESAPIFSAREVSAGVSLLHLLSDRRLSLSHLAVRGAQLEVERLASGEIRIQGRRLEELIPAPTRARGPRLRLDLADIAITFIDPAREPGSVSATVERLTARLEPEQLEGQARIGLPAAFGRQLAIDVTLPLPLPTPLAVPPDWDIRVAGSGLNLVNAAVFGFGSAGPLRSAGGDLVLGAGFRNGRAADVSLEVDLQNTALDAPGVLAMYERLAGRARWTRTEGGWQAGLSGLRIRREGRDSPEANAELRHVAAAGPNAEQWSGRAAFLRLEDLFPLVRVALAGSEFEPKLPQVLRGDVRDLDAWYSASATEPAAYRLQLAFERLGVISAAGDIAVDGLSGTATADGDGGRLELATGESSVELEQWFHGPLQAQALRGLLVWRSGPAGLRLLSDDIVAQAAGIEINSRLELHFPADATSPLIDLKATASASEARQVLRYLPLRRFPPEVVGWLERAVVAGTVPHATAELRGPLREFPFDHGEGVFRVALDLKDGTLDYAKDWPRVEGLDAEVVFDGVSMYSTRNQARIGAFSVRDYAVRIRDLREGVLALSGSQRVGLDQVFGFLRATPLARKLEPTLGRVTAGGPVDASLRLALPIKRIEDYRLDMLFDARGCRLGLQRLPLDLRELRGRVRLQNTHLSGDGLEAVMLGERVGIRLAPELNEPGVSHVAELTGATPIARVTSTFSLPLREYFEGQLAWQARVHVPAPRQEGGRALRVELASDLVGVTSALPPPLRKSAEALWPATLNLAFPDDGRIDVSGHLQPPFSWALRLVPDQDAWRIERGMLRAGPGEAHVPQQGGVEVVGRVGDLRLSDWLVVGGGDGPGLQETYRDLNLQVDRFAAIGQVFRDMEISARRGAEDWLVSARGPGAEGALSVPFDLQNRPLRADMKRLWLLEPETGHDNEITDPRNAPAFEFKGADVTLGDWRLGAVEMSVAKASDGLLARRIATHAASFKLEGDGAWRVDGAGPGRQYTQVRLTLQSNDVADTLRDLGFEPVVSGEDMRVAAGLTWPGSPAADFRAAASGQIEIQLKNGQVADVEPGGGRLLGLLSVTALPRRLSLDFRDVFDEGLAFDSIKGTFRVETGVAYTCNLGLTGPAADIAIIGSAGLGERTYDQLAVVRPQMSSMLTVGGAVLGGPVGGVTMALISQIFRKPLSTLGESYYRVSGGWDDPVVVRIQRGDVDASAFKDCERELAETLQALDAAATAEPEPGPEKAAPAGPH